MEKDGSDLYRLSHGTLTTIIESSFPKKALLGRKAEKPLSFVPLT